MPTTKKATFNFQDIVVVGRRRRTGRRRRRGRWKRGRRREKRWVIGISEEVILCTYYLSPIQIDY